MKEIASRYTVIRGGDGVESIVPNEKLITEVREPPHLQRPAVTVVLPVSGLVRGGRRPRLRAARGGRARGPARARRPAPGGAREDPAATTASSSSCHWRGSDLAEGEVELRSALFKDILKAFRDDGIAIAYRRREAA